MDLATLTDDDLAALIRDAYAEERRRATIQAAPVEAATLATQYAEAIGRADGDEWQAPTGAHDSVPVGAVVEHHGRYWRNTHGAVNPWEPGTPNAGWIEVWPDGEGGWTDTQLDPDTCEEVIPAWDERASYVKPATVEHEGVVYDLIHTNSDPGWEPGTLPSVWQARP